MAVSRDQLLDAILLLAPIKVASRTRVVITRRYDSVTKSSRGNFTGEAKTLLYNVLFRLLSHHTHFVLVRLQKLTSLNDDAKLKFSRKLDDRREMGLWKN